MFINKLYKIFKPNFQIYKQLKGFSTNHTTKKITEEPDIPLAEFQLI